MGRYNSNTGVDLLSDSLWGRYAAARDAYLVAFRTATTMEAARYAAMASGIAPYPFRDYVETP